MKAKGTRLVLVSAGTVEADRASVFRSPVLLDQSFAAGRALGVSGTPFALLVDSEAGSSPESRLEHPRVEFIAKILLCGALG